MPYAYVMSPYSHEDPEVEEARYEAVLRWCAKHPTKMMGTQRCQTLSPIVYGRQFHVRGLTGGSNFAWLEWNGALMTGAHGFILLELEGWEKSLGCNYEMGFAAASGKLLLRIRDFV